MSILLLSGCHFVKLTAQKRGGGQNGEKPGWYPLFGAKAPIQFIWSYSPYSNNQMKLIFPEMATTSSTSQAPQSSTTTTSEAPTTQQEIITTTQQQTSSTGLPSTTSIPLCVYEGHSYEIGQRWNATGEGCVTCVCRETGVICSKITCNITCDVSMFP